MSEEVLLRLKELKTVTDGSEVARLIRDEGAYEEFKRGQVRSKRQEEKVEEPAQNEQ